MVPAEQYDEVNNLLQLSRQQQSEQEDIIMRHVSHIQQLDQRWALLGVHLPITVWLVMFVGRIFCGWGAQTILWVYIFMVYLFLIT